MLRNLQSNAPTNIGSVNTNTDMSVLREFCEHFKRMIIIGLGINEDLCLPNNENIEFLNARITSE